MRVEKEIALINKYGMHVRPAGALARLCQKYMSEITVEHSGITVSGKSVLGLMTLEAPCGTVLKITAEGDDAERAVADIESLINNRFGIAGE